MTNSSSNAGLNRREAISILLKDRGDLLVVTGLGSPTYDVAALGDHPRNFYLWGAMGGAAMVGLGLAVARPDDQVMVVTGDGEQLMGLGALATIGANGPSNLTIVVLDNALYGETGQQDSHTATNTRLEEVAKACGFVRTAHITDINEVEAVTRWRVRPTSGPSIAVLKIAQTMPPRVLPARDGVYLKNRFRTVLGVAETG